MSHTNEPHLRVRIDLAYVGAGFHGWQIQPDQRSVQGDLADTLQRLLGRRCVPVGAGRTDAGVHARGQVAHALLHDAREVARVCGALPRIHLEGIQIHGVRPVSPAFDARHSATARRYAYRLHQHRNIFDPHAFEVPWRLDRSALDQACARIKGSHDFSSFCKTISLKADNTCRVDVCALEWDGERGIFHIRADRFLHHMVRNLVGLLLEIGRGGREPGDVGEILAARDRRAAGMMAPAHGLFLEEVFYPEELMDPEFLPPDFTPWPGDSADEDRAAEGDDE